MTGADSSQGEIRVLPSFIWSDHFLTGIDSVDRQHARLINLINRFGEQIADERAGRDDIAAVVAELREYTRFHFAEEEALMRTAGLASEVIGEHHRAHLDFIHEVELAEQSLEQLPEQAVRQLHDYLVYWLGYHILGIDQSMARQMHALDEGASAADALRAERERDAGAVQPLLDSIVGLLRAVQAKNREMREINASLEARVVERTAALEQAHAHMQHMAMHDALTGLPNRRRAMEFLDEAWDVAPRRPLSCLMIDADRFKEVNDCHGHDAGDEVLRQLAREIAASFRTDDLTCRLGGDEFLVLCPNTPLADALRLANSVLLRVRGLAVPTGDGHWHGSLSIGVAERRGDMEAPVELLRTADRGVYTAKSAGRNGVGCVQELERR